MPPQPGSSGQEGELGDGHDWERLGKGAFGGEEGSEMRRTVLEGVLGPGGTMGWCEEQVSC